MLLSNLPVFAQSPNTMYFMEGFPYRHFQNPALQPRQDFYLNLPVLGYTHLNLENNALSMKDFVQTDANGNTILFLNPRGNKNLFFNTLQPVTMFNTDLRINILGAGMRIYDDYLTFEINQRATAQIYAPKDMFKFLLYGTPDLFENLYELKNFISDIQSFTDVNIGYSHTKDKRLFYGGKLKLLLGNNNKSFAHSKMNLSANIDEWNIAGNGVLRSSGGDNLNVTGKFENVTYTSNGIKSVLTVAGVGAGIDLGVSYLLKENLSATVSVTDLGFIRWKKNASVTNYSIDYTFQGLQKQLNDNYSLQDLLDSVKNAMYNAREVSYNKKSYNSYLLPTLHIGLEQRFFDNKLSIGLLSRTMYNHQSIAQELTVSINARPFHWLDAAVSTSLLNGRFSSFGAGLGVKTGPLYWFTSMDYIGFENIPIPLQKIDTSLPTMTLGVPYNTQAFNFASGVSIVFNDLKWFKSYNSGYYKTKSGYNRTKKCNCNW